MTKGFTLIELLVVIAIITVLSTVVIVSLSSLNKNNTPEPCSAYSEFQIAHVPARCASYFGIASTIKK